MPSTSAGPLLATGRTVSSMFGRALIDDGQQVTLDSLAASTSTPSSLLEASTMLATAQDYHLAPGEHNVLEASEGPLVVRSDEPSVMLYTFEDFGHWTTDSRVTALIHALVASFSVILVSELGDKTFIITAIMAMKNSRSLVFLSSASALLMMTILSVGMGVAATVIPALYTHYASIVLFFCFGLKMLKESWDLKGAEGEESEFEEVERSLEVDVPEVVKGKPSGKVVADEQPEAEQQQDKKPSERWYSKLIETLHIAPIVIKVFTMIFVAEWGDRSQISTVILAARENSIGVFIGSLSGHVFCTGLAVIGGRFVADMISVRTSKCSGGRTELLDCNFWLLPQTNLTRLHRTLNFKLQTLKSTPKSSDSTWRHHILILCHSCNPHGAGNELSNKIAFQIRIVQPEAGKGCC